MNTVLLPEDEMGVVLLHGAGLGSWAWSKVREQLRFPAVAIDFPGRGKSEHVSTKSLSLNEYIKTIQDEIDRFAPRQLIIVAHSISGVLSRELAYLYEGRLKGFVAVGAAIPRTNGSFVSTLPAFQGFMLKVVMKVFGTMPPVSALHKALCNDLDEATKHDVTSKFVSESRRLYTDRLLHHGRFPHAMYVRLTEDHELLPSVQQRMIEHLQPDEIEELPSGHLPMLSKPVELAAILNRYAEERLS